MFAIRGEHNFGNELIALVSTQGSDHLSRFDVPQESIVARHGGDDATVWTEDRVVHAIVMRQRFELLAGISVPRCDLDGVNGTIELLRSLLRCGSS
jgi:hypothetical protein